jgi:pimeloyl-ACP methyl ester carboxylesterase
VDGAGIRFAYRRFGKNQGVPLVFFQHFTGTMDNWDPAVTDGLARDREVILFNNAGISSSGGETPNTIAEMARHAGAFIDALGLEQTDLLGYIKQPVLIINGSNDDIIYTVNSFILQRNLPNAQLIIYPDSNHGSQYQFPELFVEHVTPFLAGPSIRRSRETLSQAAQETRHWVEFVGAV